jgi:hypothetical protein
LAHPPARQAGHACPLCEPLVEQRTRRSPSAAPRSHNAPEAPWIGHLRHAGRKRPMDRASWGGQAVERLSIRPAGHRPVARTKMRPTVRRTGSSPFEGECQWGCRIRIASRRFKHYRRCRPSPDRHDCVRIRYALSA